MDLLNGILSGFRKGNPYRNSASPYGKQMAHEWEIQQSLLTPRGYKGYYMDESISGYWRLFKRNAGHGLSKNPTFDTLIFDDPAATDNYNKETAAASFASYIANDLNL